MQAGFSLDLPRSFLTEMYTALDHRAFSLSAFIQKLKKQMLFFYYNKKCSILCRLHLADPRDTNDCANTISGPNDVIDLVKDPMEEGKTGFQNTTRKASIRNDSKNDASTVVSNANTYCRDANILLGWLSRRPTVSKFKVCGNIHTHTHMFTFIFYFCVCNHSAT